MHYLINYNKMSLFNQLSGKIDVLYWCLLWFPFCTSDAWCNNIKVQPYRCNCLIAQNSKIFLLIDQKILHCFHRPKTLHCFHMPICHGYLFCWSWRSLLAHMLLDYWIEGLFNGHCCIVQLMQSMITSNMKDISHFFYNIG